MALKTKPCPCCNGSGRQLDRKAVGAEMKKYRTSQKPVMSLNKVGKRLGVSAAFVFYLERGQRKWNERLVDRFKKACN